MANVINRAGFNLKVTDENGKNFEIPFDNKTYYVSDWTYNKYHELLRLLKPVKQVIPPVIKIIPFNNKGNQIIQNDNFKIQQGEIHNNIEIEIMEENKKPLAGIRIKDKKRNQLIKKRKTKEETETQLNAA